MDAKWTTFSHEQCTLLISLFDVENGLKIDLRTGSTVYCFSVGLLHLILMYSI